MQGNTALDPGHFMIVTPKTGKLALYGRKLEELGIPHQVTGWERVESGERAGIVACVPERGGAS